MKPILTEALALLFVFTASLAAQAAPTNASKWEVTVKSGFVQVRGHGYGEGKSFLAEGSDPIEFVATHTLLRLDREGEHYSFQSKPRKGEPLGAIIDGIKANEKSAAQKSWGLLLGVMGGIAALLVAATLLIGRLARKNQERREAAAQSRLKPMVLDGELKGKYKGKYGSKR